MRVHLLREEMPGTRHAHHVPAIGSRRHRSRARILRGAPPPTIPTPSSRPLRGPGLGRKYLECDLMYCNWTRAARQKTHRRRRWGRWEERGEEGKKKGGRKDDLHPRAATYLSSKGGSRTIVICLILHMETNGAEGAAVLTCTCPARSVTLGRRKPPAARQRRGAGASQRASASIPPASVAARQILLN